VTIPRYPSGTAMRKGSIGGRGLVFLAHAEVKPLRQGEIPPVLVEDAEWTDTGKCKTRIGR